MILYLGGSLFLKILAGKVLFFLQVTRFNKFLLQIQQTIILVIYNYFCKDYNSKWCECRVIFSSTFVLVIH